MVLVTYSKHDFSETEFCLRLQTEYTHLSKIELISVLGPSFINRDTSVLEPTLPRVWAHTALLLKMEFDALNRLPKELTYSESGLCVL
jgi:hypothetical protein